MIQGGSPLGLIGVKSRPDISTGNPNDYRSTFPYDGKSIGVSRYNQAQDQYRPFSIAEAKGNEAADTETRDGKEKKSNRGQNTRSSISIFSRRDMPSRFTPWPKVEAYSGYGDNLPNWDKGGIQPSRLHSDSLYDTSILNILQNLKGTKAELRSTHFAYLKNVGVYPNNRLMIARRFQGPADAASNLMRKGSPAMAVMISWVKPDAENFFSIDFGEEWTDAEADLTSILNDLGDDFTKGSKVGDKMAGGLAAVPLPGFTETIQRTILSKLGIFKQGAASYIPAGEPNLIKQAKIRKLTKEGAGSGLKCNFTVAFECEWEQKFISGIDPTIVWLDIIQTVLRFGTSPGVHFGLAPGMEDKVMNYVNHPTLIFRDLLRAIKDAVESIKDAIKSAVEKFKVGLGPKEEKPQEEVAKEELADIEKQKKDIENDMNDLFSGIQGLVGTLLKNILGKYKVRIAGVLQALTGNPSGPWHVTIGNPLRPVFSSGDMLIQDTVKLSFGSTLAFNDLPSTIKASFGLSPARPLGLQEIMARFNSGHIRSVLPFPTDEELYALQKTLNLRTTSDSGEGETSTTDEKEIETAKYNNKTALSLYTDASLNPRIGEQKEATANSSTNTSPTTGTSNNNSNGNISNNTDSAGTSGTSGLQPATNSGTSGTSGGSGTSAINGGGSSKPGSNEVIKSDANSTKTTVV
jgi:hypothetical protein